MSDISMNPSLIQYLGGWGKAGAALGNSMQQAGQVKLDLQKQNDESIYKNAILKLQQDAADTAKQDKFTTKNDKLASNVATNSYLLGQNMPTEMSNDYAKLSLIDPTMTAAALKTEKDKYSATDGGLIYNTGTGQMVNDYRDKNGSGIKGAPFMEGVVGGKVVRTYFDPQTGAPKLHLTAPGKPLGIYSQDYADSIGDTNTGQRPTITNITKQDIGGSNVIANGGMPVTFASDPRIAAKQREYALPIDGGGWYIPRDMKARYMKAFPK